MVFHKSEGFADLPVVVPCGRCLGCRTAKAREWALRCKNEADLHADNAFVTLTYAEEQLPRSPSGVPTLRPGDFVNFMKRLRKWDASNRVLGPGEVPVGIRFFMAAEYGKLGRPHHHVLLFGLWFPDVVKWQKRGEHQLFRSPALERLWPFGFSSVGRVSQGSAMYVAQYALKKLVADVELGGDRVAEYQSMSNRRGIGYGWIQKFGEEVYRDDAVVEVGGRMNRPPRYYDQVRSDLSDGVKASRRGLVDDRESCDSRRYAVSEVLRARQRAYRKDL